MNKRKKSINRKNRLKMIIKRKREKIKKRRIKRHNKQKMNMK